MKSNYILILLLSVLFFSCSKDDNRNVIKWQHNDLLRLEYFVGSPTGGKIPSLFDETSNPDSLKITILKDGSKYFAGKYKEDYFRGMELEFNDNMLDADYYQMNKMTVNPNVIGRDSMLSKGSLVQIIAPYLFRKDSLFVMKSDSTINFVTQGNLRKMYRMQSLLKYHTQSDNDTIIVFDDEVLTQEKALNYSGYNNISNMTHEKDVLLWCNVKYNFY